MGRNTSVILGDHFEQFVDEQVSTGRYGSASEVARAGLRLLEEHEARRASLRQALVDGEHSGVTEVSVEEIWAAAEAGHAGRNG